MPRSRQKATANTSSSTLMESITTFGELLKYLRRRAGLTQYALGIAVGYSESQIARLESGQRLPDVLAVKTHFVAALGLQFEPALSKRMVELATAARAAPSTTAEITSPGLAAKHNLPLSLTRLIDREQNIAAVRELLSRADTRLITLLGPPGVGKTSLAMEVARTMCDSPNETFADGVWFIPLAPVSAPQLVPAAIAQNLALPASQADPLTSLKQHLRNKRLLLVLDNFEQVLGATAAIVDLITAVPQIKILVTSRTALRITGEYIVEVPPLGDTSAVELFIDRAQRIQPDFTLTPQMRVTATEICRRLDGLPLAIELAAACLRLFNPQALLARLTTDKGDGTPSVALDLLSDGPRNLAAHQRTMRTAIGWSYDLLTPSQQRLLRSLSVFAGGCALDAVQAVAARAVESRMVDSTEGSQPALTSDLQALIDSSLVKRHDGSGGEPRFTLLEVIREFATEQLQACGESDAVHQRHSAYLLKRAQDHAPAICRQSGSPFGSMILASATEVDHWMKQLAQERDNFRAALAWTLREARDTPTGVQLALWQYPLWRQFGAHDEASEWLECALAHAHAPAGVSPADITTWARRRAAILALLSESLVIINNPRAVQLAHEAIETFRALGTRGELLVMLQTLMNVEFERNNLPAAQAACEEALTLAGELGVKRVEWSMMFYLGEIALTQQDLPNAIAWIERCERRSPSAGEWPALSNLQGMLACYRGDFTQAERHCRKAVAGFKRIEFSHGVATARHSLGDIALFQGDLVKATSHFKQGLHLFSENDNRQRAAWCLAGLAATAATAWRLPQAATLWAAVQAIRASIGSPRPPLRIDDYRTRVDAARQQIDARSLASAEIVGRAMSFQQAVEYALNT